MHLFYIIQRLRVYFSVLSVRYFVKNDYICIVNSEIGSVSVDNH